jgi:O-antigen/teichoic acid export membrane protein
VGGGVTAVTALIWAAVFTRILPAEDYGRYALVLSAVVLAGNLLHQWLSQGITRYLPGMSASADEGAFKYALATALLGVAAAAALVASMVVPFLLPRLAPEWRPLLLPGAAVAVLTALWMPLGAVLQAEFRAGRYTVYQSANASLRLAAALALMLSFPRPEMLLWATAVALLVLVPFQWREAGLPSPIVLVRKSGSSAPVFEDGDAHRPVIDGAAGPAAVVRRIAAYGLPMVRLAGGGRGTGREWSLCDPGIFAEPARWAFTANYSLVSNAVLIACSPLLLAAHPLLMRTWSAGDAAGAARWLGTIIELFLVAGMVMTAGLAIFSPEVSLLLGPQYREGHRVLPLVLAGGVLWQLANYTHKPLEFLGRTRFLFALAAGAALLNILLNILLVPRFGYLAAAWTTLACFALYTVTTAVRGRAALHWRLDLRLLWSTALLCTGAVLLARPCADAPPVRTVALRYSPAGGRARCCCWAARPPWLLSGCGRPGRAGVRRWRCGGR